jgi:hypothetical protein
MVVAPIEMDHGRDGEGGVDAGDSDGRAAGGRWVCGGGDGADGARGRACAGRADGAGQLAEDNCCYKSLLKIGCAYQKRCCEPHDPPTGTVRLFFPSRAITVPLADRRACRGKTAFGAIPCGSHPLYPLCRIF